MNTYICVLGVGFLCACVCDMYVCIYTVKIGMHAAEILWIRVYTGLCLEYAGLF